MQPSIVTRGPYSASVEVTTDGASPASEVVSVSGAMTAWRVRVEVPEGVMSNTSVSLDVSESGPLLYPFDESDPYSGLSVLSVETSSESVSVICGSWDRSMGVDVGRTSEDRAVLGPVSPVSGSALVGSGNESVSLSVSKSGTGIVLSLCNVSSADTRTSSSTTTRSFLSGYVQRI